MSHSIRREFDRVSYPARYRVLKYRYRIDNSYSPVDTSLGILEPANYRRRWSGPCFPDALPAAIIGSITRRILCFTVIQPDRPLNSTSTSFCIPSVYLKMSVSRCTRTRVALWLKLDRLFSFINLFNNID